MADVNARKRMNFTINSVVDLGLSPAHTRDKLKSVFAPATRAGEVTDKSDRLASRHRIAEVTDVRVNKVQAYRDYIKNSEIETRNVFEQEKNSIDSTRSKYSIDSTK